MFGDPSEYEYKIGCNDVILRETCTFGCVDGKIALNGSFEVTCQADRTYLPDPLTSLIVCEDCPVGTKNNGEYTKCLQNCLSNDDPRTPESEYVLCKYNSGNIPINYHCTDHNHCESGYCSGTTNKCVSNPYINETIFENDVLYNGRMIATYKDLVSVIECRDKCINGEYPDCTHFSFSATENECRLGTERVFSKRMYQYGWISGFMRQRSRFEIVFKQDLTNEEIYFSDDNMYYVNNSIEPGQANIYSNLQQFWKDDRYRGTNNVTEFILNIDGTKYYWTQNWTLYTDETLYNFTYSLFSVKTDILFVIYLVYVPFFTNKVVGLY